MNCSKRINDGLACSVSWGDLLLSSLGVAQIESQKTPISAPPPNVSVVQLQILGVGSDIAANVLFNGGLASLPAACLVETDFSLHRVWHNLNHSSWPYLRLWRHSIAVYPHGMNIITTSGSGRITGSDENRVWPAKLPNDITRWKLIVCQFAIIYGSAHSTWRFRF